MRGHLETVQEFITERDDRVLSALEMARGNRLPAFGCAPMAGGSGLATLLCAGIRADHECYSAAETLEKLRNGMYVMLRESSVAHFLDENIKVITENGVKTDRIGFCTDDVTAADVLRDGHLDRLVRMAIERGVPPVKAIQMATINVAQIYQVDGQAGVIAPGRLASILLVDDPASFRVQQVIAKGRLAASCGRMTPPAEPPPRSTALLRTFRNKQLGCRFPSPFMYMIFLSVTAIPDYAMTDLGLIDCVSLNVISPILGPAGDAHE